MATKRLHYFTGQFLKEADFTAEQKYHLDMRRRHSQHLHTAGIAYGLKVAPGTNVVTVEAGMAVDPQGREVVLEALKNVPVASAPVAIVISYSEKESDETSETGVKGNTRWEETADVAAVPINSVDSAKHVVLARVTGISGAGVVTLDTTSFRPTYSAPTVLGDLEVKRDLAVQGNLTVQGKTTVVQTQEMRGDVVLGDADADTVTIKGSLKTGHSSGRLQIGSPVHVNGEVTMTGALTLPGNPATALQAAPKQYIDSHTAAANPHSGSLAKTGDTMSGQLSITAAGTGLSVTNNTSVGGNLTVGGDVGIGTASPTRKIQTQTAIDQYSYSQTDGTIELATFLNGGFQSGMIGTVTNHPFQIYTSNSGPVMTLTTGGTSGNVGIGTTSPAERLDVNGRVKSGSLTVGPWPANPANYMFFGVNTLNQALAGNYALLQGIADGPGRTFLNSPVDIRFRIGNTDKMILANNGNIGIGTTTPDAPLHVADHIAVGPFSATGGVGGIDVAGSAAEFGFVRRTLASWPATPAAGDRFVWYNPNGTARLWTHVIGDLITVQSDGDVTIKGNLGTHGFTSTPKTPGWGGGIHTWDVEAEGTIRSWHGVLTGPPDLAENYLADIDLEPGNVVCLDKKKDRIATSERPNDALVLGVISTTPGFLLNVSQKNEEENAKVFPVALCGRVPCKVVAENGPIKRGDLLTSSSTPGHAMKAEPIEINGGEFYRPGTIIGKALGSLKSGKGVIDIFVFSS